MPISRERALEHARSLYQQLGNKAPFSPEVMRADIESYLCLSEGIRPRKQNYASLPEEARDKEKELIPYENLDPSGKMTRHAMKTEFDGKIDGYKRYYYTRSSGQKEERPSLLIEDAESAGRQHVFSPEVVIAK